DEEKSLRALAEDLEYGRQVQALERAYLVRDEAQRNGDVALYGVAIHAEARLLGVRIGKVDGLLCREPFIAVCGRDSLQVRCGQVRGEYGVLEERHKRPGNAQERIAPD